jgi:Zn-dependent protease with chaperone function
MQGAARDAADELARKRTMNDYSIVKFLHVSGAIGYFVALGTLLFGLAALRRARRVEHVRVLADLVRRLTPLFNISILLLLAAGLYMTFTVWSLQMGWIAVALVSLAVIVPISAVTVQSRMRIIAQLAREAPDGPLPPELLARTHDPVFLTTPQTAMALLLGIVFLMTNKPSLPVALLVMALALILGLASGVLVARSTRIVGQNVAANATRASESGG